MFTGIVTAVGEIHVSKPVEGGRDLAIVAPFRGIVIGESIAVQGACLTVTMKGRGWFGVRAVPSTLERTRFGEFRPGDRVNLERALKAGDPLGGHLVQGHVDGLGVVVAVKSKQDARLVDLRVPDPVARVTIPLGSLTVDGVSLTVNALVGEGIIQVSLIPHTLAHTTLGALAAGDRVHLEGDVIGKYLRAFLEPRSQGAAKPGDGL
jgi:riboflavin synthase